MSIIVWDELSDNIHLVGTNYLKQFLFGMNYLVGLVLFAGSSLITIDTDWN